MNRECFKAVILGASFLGIGTALTLENCCVIEPGGVFGAEFVNTYRICRPNPITVNTKLGKVFLDDLKRRGLVSADGEVYQSPSVYVLSQFLKEKECDIRLMNGVLSIKQQDGVFILTLYHQKGFETITAKRIIDTTTLGIHREALSESGIKKSLNAVLFNPSGNSMPGLFHNRLSGIYTYSLDVPLECSRYEAVEKLCSLESLFRQNNMKISSIAPEFSYVFAESLSDKGLGLSENGARMRVPSSSRSNPVIAFDDGVSLGERICA